MTEDFYFVTLPMPDPVRFGAAGAIAWWLVDGQAHIQVRHLAWQSAYGCGLPLDKYATSINPNGSAPKNVCAACLAYLQEVMKDRK